MSGCSLLAFAHLNDFAGNDGICLGSCSNRINVGYEVRPGRAGLTPILLGESGQTGRAGSGREPFVPVMQPANLWKRDNVPRIRRLHRPTIGSVLVQRKMRAGAVVIVEIRSQNSPQVGFVQNDDVIEDLAPDRADHALDVWGLPGRSRRGQDFRDRHGRQAFPNDMAIGAIAIPDEISRRCVPRKRLDDLLCDRDRGRAFRDTDKGRFSVVRDGSHRPPLRRQGMS